MLHTRVGILLGVGLGLVLAIGRAEAASAPPKEARSAPCASTREYVATLEYLRSNHDLGVAEPDARQLALEVSSGCTGAALRFIRGAELLLRSGTGGRDALAYARDLALKTDREADAFGIAFKHAFLEDYLDLDLPASLALARSLSIDFKGDVETARDDFRKLVEFCSGRGSLDLPKARCADLATRLTRLGQGIEGGVAKTFLQSYKFLTEDGSGPHLTAGTAIGVAESVAAFGPGAEKNFQQGYKYAASKGGLGAPVADSLAFARKMAERTRP